MTNAVIITLCLLLLTAYVFDLSSGKTKIPSVVLLLALGFLVKQIVVATHIPVPDLSEVLPVLGTIGLVLIVLEGALELELNKGKLPLIGRASLVALLPMLVLGFSIAGILHYGLAVSWKSAWINAIPFAVISSAIAIPSARKLPAHQREFVTYESSLSDIFGVMIFNFLAFNHRIDGGTFGSFVIDILFTIFIALAATLALSYLLARIKHHVKFVPLMLLTLLVYALAKAIHLPALLFILFFGLFLGNLDEWKRFAWIRQFHPENLDQEAKKFKELIMEFTFLIRALFFILFGYLIELSDLLNLASFINALGICVAIFALRAFSMWIMGVRLLPVLFIAPRGLITILLYLSIPTWYMLPEVSRSLVTQVILITAFVMMLGMMFSKTETRPESAAV